MGGRPKGLSAAAQKKAIAAEALYKAKLSVADIARNQDISKATLYSYLRHRGVQIGAYKKPPLKPKVMKVEISLTVENNSKFVRGKTKSREEIEDWVLSRYGIEKPHKDSHRYMLTIPYQTDEELDHIIYQDILAEAHRLAESRNGFVEADVISLDDPERSW